MVVVFSSLRRQQVSELPRHDVDRLHWFAHRGSSNGKLLKCERCNFAENKSRVLMSNGFSLVPGLASSGTWLESCTDQNGAWQLKCVLCNVSLGVTRHRQLARHANTLQHRKAVQSLNLTPTTSSSSLDQTPSSDQFKELLDHVRKSPLGANIELEKHVGGRHKQRRMLWCLAEASRSQQRDFLMRCGTMAIYQDARKSFLLDRWSASDAKLDFKFGHLWGTKLLESHSLDAEGLQRATLDGLTCMCTARLAPPQLSKGTTRWSGGVLNVPLLDHCRQIIEV